MTSIKPVNKTSHSAMRWKPFSDMRFAERDVFAPLVRSELRRAAAVLPVAFLEHEGTVIPIALQGLKLGQNLCLTPQGKWAFPYIPAVYRAYPFSLRDTPDGQRILCVDEDSDLLNPSDGELFFQENGEPAERIAQVLHFLTAVANDRAPTNAACALLKELELLIPWRITYQEDGEQKVVAGLQQVDETALSALDGAALERLQEVGALNLVFCQLLSMQNIGTLQRLNAFKQTAFDPEKDDIEELLGLPEEEIIEFGF